MNHYTFNDVLALIFGGLLTVVVFILTFGAWAIGLVEIFRAIFNVL